MEEHRLRVFGNRKLRDDLWALGWGGGVELIGDRNKAHDEELQDL